MRAAVLLMSLLLVSAPSLAAAPDGAPVDALFIKGNQAYFHKDYKTAIDSYEQVLALGVIHEDLYYALGNAYFKADRLGPAILNYERALALDPAQEDAAANLKLARDTAASRWQDKLQGAEKDPLWMRGLSTFTSGGLTLVFLGLYSAMFLLVLLVYFLPSGFLRVATVVLLIFTIAGTASAGGLLGGRWWLQTRGHFGIVLPDELAVREGPDADYPPAFLIHAGLRVRAVTHDQDWIRVRLSNGLEGWVRDRDVGRL